MNKNISLPLISIVTVVLNGAKYIEETILSVVRCKEFQIQYIVIDGGSTDGTLDIIKKYQSNIDYFISEPDDGIYDAMNKGIGAATGLCVALLNCGDYYGIGTIEAIVGELAKCDPTSYYVFAGGVSMVDEEKSIVASYLPSNQRIQQRFLTMPLNHPAMFVSASVYRDFGLYNSALKIAADYEFVLKIIESNVPIFLLPKVLTNMRAGGISDSWRSLIRRVIEIYFIIKKYKTIGFCLVVSAREVIAYVVRPLRRNRSEIVK